MTVKKLAAIYKDRMGKTAESTKSEMGHSDQFINDCLKVYEKLLKNDYINGKLDSLLSSSSSGGPVLTSF